MSDCKLQQLNELSLQTLVFEARHVNADGFSLLPHCSALLPLTGRYIPYVEWTSRYGPHWYRPSLDDEYAKYAWKQIPLQGQGVDTNPHVLVSSIAVGCGIEGGCSCSTRSWSVKGDCTKFKSALPTGRTFARWGMRFRPLCYLRISFSQETCLSSK